MDKSRKKELLSAYKERLVVGGVYIIRNNRNSKMLLQSTTELQGSKNQFEFSQQTESFCHMKLQEDWKRFGNKVFTFEVLEELIKQENQTDKEFKEDIKVLEEIWREKLDADKLY